MEDFNKTHGPVDVNMMMSTTKKSKGKENPVHDTTP
jgi:hypothetical protein